MTTDDKNKILLDFYMQGFNDELYSKSHDESQAFIKLMQKAYRLGRQDALIGDDLASSDAQSNEQILKKISI